MSISTTSSPTLAGVRRASEKHRGDWGKLEIKSWEQFHHLERMKSYGHSVARSIARSQGDGDLARGRTL